MLGEASIKVFRLRIRTATKGKTTIIVAMNIDNDLYLKCTSIREAIGLIP
jgi:hypothetical protein